jgi:hypothetical protein
MSHGTEQHLEHAEHVQHAALNPFDRQVAMTMAIIAAVLAGATLLSHRGHNDVLRLQTEANIFHTRASDMWAFYQAKNIRSHEFQAYVMMASFLAKEQNTDAVREKAVKYWSSQVEKYEGSKGPDGKRGGELAKLKSDAEELEKTATEREHESHVVHHSVNWIDFGHLGLEFALVLCSVAVLTKQRTFWFSGFVVAVAGASLALFGVYALLLAPH